MTKLTKKAKALQGKVESTKLYPLSDALNLVKDLATAKFDESVDVAVNLGIDTKKSDQTVRGSVVLPAGTGKKVRVAVFAQDAVEEQLGLAPERLPQLVVEVRELARVGHLALVPHYSKPLKLRYSKNWMPQ